MKNRTNTGGVAESHFLRDLGRRLRVARESCQMSVEGASKASGVKPPSIGRYERAEAEAGARKIAALASAYGVCCNWLLGQGGEMKGLAQGQAVVDLDMIDKVEDATTEEDMESLVCWNPAPIQSPGHVVKGFAV